MRSGPNATWGAEPRPRSTQPNSRYKGPRIGAPPQLLRWASDIPKALQRRDESRPPSPGACRRTLPHVSAAPAFTRLTHHLHLIFISHAQTRVNPPRATSRTHALRVETETARCAFTTTNNRNKRRTRLPRQIYIPRPHRHPWRGQQLDRSHRFLPRWTPNQRAVSTSYRCFTCGSSAAPSHAQ